MDICDSVPVSLSNQRKKQSGQLAQETCQDGAYGGGAYAGGGTSGALFRSGSQNDSGYSSQASISSLNGLAESLPLPAKIVRTVDPEYCYKMDHRKRGRCIIINNTKFKPGTGMSDRPGSDVDAANMHRICKKLKFDVELLNNQTLVQMMQCISKIAKEDHRDSDCFALVILSHGDNGTVYGTDGFMKLEALLDPLKGVGCPSLVGKPKLVFVQACRGTQLDEGVDVSDAKPDNNQKMEETLHKLPTEADFLYAFSSPAGFYSFRNNKTGSWFIQAVADIFDKHAEDLEILQLLTRVCRKVAVEFESRSKTKEHSGKKQIPSFVSMLTKELYFK